MTTTSALPTLKGRLVLRICKQTQPVKYVRLHQHKKLQEVKLSGTTKTKAFGTVLILFHVQTSAASPLISIASSKWATMGTLCP